MATDQIGARHGLPAKLDVSSRIALTRLLLDARKAGHD